MRGPAGSAFLLDHPCASRRYGTAGPRKVRRLARALAWASMRLVLIAGLPVGAALSWLCFAGRACACALVLL